MQVRPNAQTTELVRSKGTAVRESSIMGRQQGIKVRCISEKNMNCMSAGRIGVEISNNSTHL